MRNYWRVILGVTLVWLSGCAVQSRQEIEAEKSVQVVPEKTATKQPIVEISQDDVILIEPNSVAEQGKVIAAEAEKLSSTADKSRPQIFFSEQTYNFGKVSAGSIESCTFLLTNVGDAPLEISEIRKTCGCTTTRLGKKVLEPGESSRLSVHLSTGKRVGKRVRHVVVMSNDPNNPKAVLTVTADVQQGEENKTKTSSAKASDSQTEMPAFGIIRRPRNYGKVN